MKHIAFCLIMSCLLLLSCNKTVTTSYETIGYLEKLESAFDEIVPPSTIIEIISKNHNWTEGPVWSPKEQMLLFSDVPENKIYKWTKSGGMKPYLLRSGYSGQQQGVSGSNGLVLDKDGLLILCRSGDREIARMNSSPSAPSANFKTLSDSYDGMRFNSPNDLVLDKSGNIYFTDPNFGMPHDSLKEMNYQGVYKITLDGTTHLLSSSCPTPNGIGLSPDQQTLYVANSRPPKLFAWNLVNDTATNERLLFDATELWKQSISKQPPDGIAINKDGVIFMTGPDGVLVINEKGKHLGTIRTDKLTSNCTFNEDESILYVTCDDLVLRVNLKSKKPSN